MLYSEDEDKDLKPKTIHRKVVYLIMDGKKVYIDPEIVQKYHLKKQGISFFTGRKLYEEED